MSSSEAEKSIESHAIDIGIVAQKRDALASAESHVRAAKGVLDTFGETREHCDFVEKTADRLAKLRKPLEDELLAHQQRARHPLRP